MERERELAKLVNVLRQTARMAFHSARSGSAQDSATFCVEQYNRVLTRLKEIDPSVGGIFQPLAAGSSLIVTAIACRQLAAYYEDEVGGVWGWDRACGVGFDAQAFKGFWNKSAQELEGLGEFLRDCFAEWVNQRRKAGEAPKA